MVTRNRGRLATLLAITVTVGSSTFFSSANAEPISQADTVEVQTQEQLEDLDFQIDMNTVVAEMEITVNTLGTITVSQGGQEMVVNQDGSWLIREERSGMVTPTWNAGVCYGNFVSVYVNNEGDLQWGGQQVCNSTTKRPHKIDVSLRQGPDKFLGTQITKHTSIGKYSYTRVASNIKISPCLNRVIHRTSMVVTPYAGGVQWPKVVSKDTVVRCNTR